MTSKLDQLRKICQPYCSYNNNASFQYNIVDHESKYVFKKCIDEYKNQYLVVLEKISQTRHNESRSNVFNKDRAGFRGSVFKVILIIDIENLNSNLDAIRSCYEKIITQVGKDKKINIIYTDYIKGKLVYPDFYDENINNISSNGIHYFKTLDATYYYDIDQKRNIDEYCIRFNPSGAKEAEGLYANNNMHGIWIYYSLNEQPGMCVTYNNGIEIS